MYQRALEGKEKLWGFKHIFTLSIVNNLGLLYTNQGKMNEAEKMYQLALRGCEKALGLKHMSIVKIAGNLRRLRERRI